MYTMIVWTMIIKNDKILLLKRRDNMQWTAVGGHVEEEESLKTATCREAIEEVGIEIKQEDLNPLCVINRRLKKLYRFHMFFYTSKWNREPKNKEPNTHLEIKWYNLNNLPSNLCPLASAAISSLTNKKIYHFVSDEA